MRAFFNITNAFDITKSNKDLLLIVFLYNQIIKYLLIVTKNNAIYHKAQKSQRNADF